MSIGRSVEGRATIGLPRERAEGELRTLLTPEGVHSLVREGFLLKTEHSLGLGVGFEDAAYRSVGAQIVEASEAWNCPLVLKYKAPVSAEYKYLRPGLVLGAILHAEGNRELTKALLEKKVTAHAFEFFQTSQDSFPLMRAGGCVAGMQAITYASYFLQSSQGGMGKVLGAWPGGPGARVLIIGSGTVGSTAADLAARMGAEVVVLCSTEASAARYRESAREGIDIRVNSPRRLAAELPRADVVVGAILISTFDTPPMVTDAMVESMKPGSVLIDATAGYGPGYMESFTIETDLAAPSFMRHGVVHVKIGNLPAAVPVSAVSAVNALYPPFLVNFARSVFDPEFTDAVSGRGLVVSDGTIKHPELLRHATELGW